MASAAIPYVKTQRQRDRLVENVSKTLQDASQWTTSEKLVSSVLQSVKDLEFDRARFYRVSDDRTHFELVGSVDEVGKTFNDGPRIYFHNNPYAEKTDRELIGPCIFDPTKGPLGVDPDHAVLEKPEDLPWAVVPLRVRRVLIGQIVADNRKRRDEITDTQLKGLELIASAANFVHAIERRDRQMGFAKERVDTAAIRAIVNSCADARTARLGLMGSGLKPEILGASRILYFQQRTAGLSEPFYFVEGVGGRTPEDFRECFRMMKSWDKESLPSTSEMQILQLSIVIQKEFGLYKLEAETVVSHRFQLTSLSGGEIRLHDINTGSPLHTAIGELIDTECDLYGVQFEHPTQGRGLVLLDFAWKTSQDKDVETSDVSEYMRVFFELWMEVNNRDSNWLRPHICQDAMIALGTGQLDVSRFYRSASAGAMATSAQSTESFVMSIDLRHSTELMLKAIDPLGFAEFIRKVAEECESVVRDECYGVFEKFTGDGILAFFPSFYTGESAGYWVIRAANECHRRFAKVFTEYRDTFSCELSDVGLGIGVDWGQVAICRIGSRLNIVGRAVVYACRLSSAPAGHTYANRQALVRLTQCADLENAFAFNPVVVEIKHESDIVAYDIRQVGYQDYYKSSRPNWAKQ